MASSNRHWPSMFKSKPCNPHHQWQHDISPSHISPCQKAPYASGSEERSPDPKPRWNPKPEQIRILEAIFNSGMVNPPRDEIRRIRVQLQEYGQVGDANVFYWFQNRKSRSKHKQRSHLHTSKTHTQSSSVAATTFVAPSSSSSSSSEKSPPNKRTNNLLQMAGSSGVNIIDAAANSPTASVNQTYFQSHQGDFSADPFFYPVVQQTGNSNNTLFSQGLCFPELSNIVQIPDQVIVPCTGFLLSEILNQNATAKRDEEQEKLKLEQQLSYTAVTTTNSTTTTTTTPNTIPSSSTSVGSININQILQGGEDQCGAGGGLGLATAVMKSTVFINNVAVEVALGPFNVRDAFGEDALLIHSSGQPVATNEWGVTLQSLLPDVGISAGKDGFTTLWTLGYVLSRP